MPALIATLVLLIFAGYLLLFARSTFVLAYHGVGTEHSEIPALMIQPGAFRRQMRLLAALGFRSRTVDSVVETLSKEGRPWLPLLSVTFDDGYRNIRENALPLLRAMGWSATLFVPTGHVGGRNEWDRNKNVASIPLLDWNDLQLLSEQGISVGSHGKTHRSLTDLTEDEVRAELRDSLAALRSHLPASSRVLSYPFGHRHPKLGPLLQQEGYIAACSLVAGALPSSDDLFDLGRLCVRGNSIIQFAYDLAVYPMKGLLRNLLRRQRGK
ncbi:MAG TPA: polysaccharide deacetylase family protein [Acidobacteriota bacterium]